MGDVPLLKNEEDSLDLPPGFRFHPTDEEIITHYLSPKVLNPTFTTTAIGDVDLNKSEPWDLPSKAKMGEKEWYFFCQKDRKYPTGMRTNRATEAGYWKATGKDKEIFRGKRVLVGMKKTLVFYRGRAPKGEKTNWVMHEFRLEGKSHLPRTAKEEWAVCKVFHKNMGIKRSPIPGLAEDLLYSPTLPPLLDPPYFDPGRRPRSSYTDEVEGLDFKATPSYFTTMQGMEDLQASINHHPQTSAFYPQNPSPYFRLPAGPARLGYSHPDQHALLRALAATDDASPAMRRYSKVEQFSGQSMVSASPDTAMSADRNTEISSVASKQERGSCRSYDELDDPSSVGPVMDLENMWNY